MCPRKYDFFASLYTNRSIFKLVESLYAPIVFAADYREMGEAPYWILKILKDTGAFQRDTWGAQIAEVSDATDE